MGDGSLKGRVHFELAARRRGEAGGFEIQQIGVGLAADRIHQARSVNVLAAFETGSHPASLVHLN